MRLSAIWQFFYSDPMRYSMGGEKRVFAAHTRRRRAEKGIDNTPDLPPFTSPFNYVIIFTISELCRLEARRPISGEAALFLYMGVGAWH